MKFFHHLLLNPQPFKVSSPATIIRPHNSHAKGCLPSLQTLWKKPDSYIPLHDLEKFFPIHVLVWFNVWLVGLNYSHFNILHKASSFHAPVKFRGLKLMKKSYRGILMSRGSFLYFHTSVLIFSEISPKF